jgi:hypothetical protein
VFKPGCHPRLCIRRKFEKGTDRYWGGARFGDGWGRVDCPPFQTHFLRDVLPGARRRPRGGYELGTATVHFALTQPAPVKLISRIAKLRAAGGRKGTSRHSRKPPAWRTPLAASIRQTPPALGARRQSAATGSEPRCADFTSRARHCARPIGGCAGKPPSPGQWRRRDSDCDSNPV